MKVKQSDLKIGDIILIPKLSNLVVGRVDHITKSGSIRYSFCSKVSNMQYYYDFETDLSKADKTAYIQKPWKPEYDRFFWLLERPEE